MDPGDGLDALVAALTRRSARPGRRVALVEEGGGMRGAFGAGVQAGFAEAGMRFDAFDALYGSSAGALNLMYWVSRRPGIGTRVYSEDLVRTELPRFFLHGSPWDFLRRLGRGEPALDLSAVGHAMSVLHPIDLAAVRSHHAPIRVPVSHAGDLRTDMLDVRSLAAADLMPALLAGATVPVLADLPSNGGEQLFDGAFLEPLPIRQALDDGCTDLVVILSVPRWKSPPAWQEWILRGLAGRRGVPATIARSLHIGRQARKAAIAMLRRPPAGVNVTVVAPEIMLATPLEQRPRWIKRLVDAGASAGRLAVELARLRVGA